jgi:hydroxypyruvate isomerase
MPRFAANISLMYPEHAMLDRIAAAARDGFAAVEVQFPYAVAAEEFRRALADARVALVLLNAPVAEFAGGDKGLAALPGHSRGFDESIARAADYARVTGAPRVHVMAGVPGPEVAAADADQEYRENLTRGAVQLARAGLQLLIEPINRRDVPGYHLHRLEDAAAVIEAAPDPRPSLQFDFYHLQIIGGDLVRQFERYLGSVGHVQIAGVPARNEPDTGEVNYPFVFRELDRLGYRGWVGCEYRPARPGPGGTSAGLGWLRRP